jgi:AcrR family transcriptional regulator
MLKRLPADDRENATERIRKAAIVLFKARGYHGTPVRELASIVKMEAASLYYHFASKQQILFNNFARTMDDLLEGLRQAVDGEPSPEARLRAAVRFHVLFHTERQDEAFISHTELRALTEQNRRRVIVKRDHYERMFCDLLSAGVDAGVFRIADIRLTNIAILTMCSGVADWFSEGGRLGAETVAEHYTNMVLRLVGYSDHLRSGDRKRAKARGKHGRLARQR